MNKNKIILGVFALVSVLAIALGFAAAFGNMQTQTSATAFGEITIQDGFNQLKDIPEQQKELMNGTFLSHINFAWIGGIITGTFGVLGLGAAGFMMFKGIELNKTLMITLALATTTMLALAIAAIVCQMQLNSATWVTENIQKKA